MVDSNDLMGLDVKVGNPWSILPIKNNKYAKDLVEVHLSDRGLNALEKFNEFPNLEVVWLNNNSVSKPQPMHVLQLANSVCTFVSCSYKTWMTYQVTSE